MNTDRDNGLSADETSRLRLSVALVLLEKQRLEILALDALGIIGPLAELAEAFTGDAGEVVIERPIPVVAGEPPRSIRIDARHLHWARSWRERFYSAMEGDGDEQPVKE